MVDLKRHRARVFGIAIVINANAKRGYRISPGVNARSRRIQKCAKGQGLKTRRACFKSGG